MKRSEMHSEITTLLINIIQNSNRLHTSQSLQSYSEAKADFLLNYIEAIGMLPPEYTAHYTRTYRRNGNVLGTSEKQYQENGWEPEADDEAK